MGRKTHYTNQELEFVSQNRTMTAKQLHIAFVEQFNRTNVSPEHLKRLRLRNGWKTGRTGQYEKGRIPHPNARPKGPNKSTFKKGHRPINERPAGSERVNVEGYREIKMGDKKTDWRLKHRIEWEKHNGPVQKGHIIRFKDGNSLNCHISNLEQFSKAEHIELNRLKHNQAHPDLKPSIVLLAKIQVKKSNATKRLQK